MHTLQPILYVRDFREATAYYTEQIFFDVVWEWERPPTFGRIRLGNVEIFLCLQGQSQLGMWLSCRYAGLGKHSVRRTRRGPP